jgi:hypothetical protein
MKRIAYILAAAALLTLPSCRFIRVSDEFKEKLNGYAEENALTASDNIISRNDVTGEFHSIQSNVPGDVLYTPGNCAIKIEGPDNVLQHIKVYNDNGTLTIKTDGTKFRKLQKLSIKLSSPVLEDLDFNGAVDFNAPEGITALDFNLTVNGAGDIFIAGLKADRAALTVNGAGDVDVDDLDCERVAVAVNGAGDANVAGRAASANLSISGAGDIDASGLQCPKIESSVHGIGRIKKP